MFADGAGEAIVVIGSPGGVDDDGYPLPGGADVEIRGCRVQRAGSGDLTDEYRDGSLDRLRVFAPAGTVIASGRDVLIRGERYRVDGVVFDWSVGRRAVVARHSPGVEFTVKRGEA